jgi:hypothetical protein
VVKNARIYGRITLSAEVLLQSPCRKTLKFNWLEISVTDAEGKLVYQNGKVDEKGDIDSHSSITERIIIELIFLT